MSDKSPVSYQEIIKQEYTKCAASPVYFMRHYVKIQHPIRGSILFDLYPFQASALQDFADYKFNIILKSRQMGISTLVAAYSLWLMIFNKDKNILLISLKQDDAKEVITKVRFANENLPTWLKIKCLEDNRLSLKYANGSSIKAASTTKKSGVGQALSLLIIDEAGLIEEAEDLWTSAQPALSTGGNCIILSTPRGVGSFFHKMWIGSEEGCTEVNKIGKNGFHPIKLPWHFHPERDQNWRDIEGAKQGNPKKAAREFDCDFMSTGDNVIDLAIIEFYKKNKKQDPIETIGADKCLWRWQFPDPSHTYIVSADVARGDGTDFSACHVIDIATSTPTQVAEYKGSYGTKDFGNFLVALATEYNDALLIVERENVGWATIQAIIDRNYKNLFYSSADLKYVDVQRQLSNKYDSEDKKIVPGFSTNIKTRPLVISHLEQFLREKAIEIYSTRILSELETFVWKNGKAQAMQGYNDDLCVLEDTWIKTNCGYKMIKDIDIGEYVFTHKNRYRRVTAKFISEKDDYNILESVGKMNLGITGNHPIYMFDKIQGNESYYKSTGTWNKISNPQFTSLDELNGEMNKYLVSMIPSDINDVSTIDMLHYAPDNYCLCGDDELTSMIITEDRAKINPKVNTISRYVNVNNEFCFVMGYFLAEGSKTKNGISFATHKKETALRNYVSNILKKYGFNPFEYYSKNNLGCILTIQSPVLKKFFEPFGVSSNKRLPLEFSNLPKEKLIYILCGYLAGDGCFDGNFAKSITISPHIAFQMHEIASKYGIISTLKGLTSQKAVTKICNFGKAERECVIQPIIRQGFNLIDHPAIKLLYELRGIGHVDHVNKHTKIKIHDNFVLGKITSIRPIKSTNKVQLHNLEVEEDNSYVANGIVVHNCMALGIGLWVRDTALRLRQEGIDLTRTALGSIDRNKIDNTPVYKNNQNNMAKKSWEMQTGRSGIGRQGTEDIRWLIS